MRNLVSSHCLIEITTPQYQCHKLLQALSETALRLIGTEEGGMRSQLKGYSELNIYKT